MPSMLDEAPPEPKVCPKCGSTDRVRNGAGRTRCRPCNQERKRKRYERAEGRTDVMTHHEEIAPEGMWWGKSTVHFDKHGEVIQSWDRLEPDPQNKVHAVIDAFESLTELIPVVETIPPPAVSDNDLMCVYPMGDPHIGMKSWAAETGDNFDLEIAERELLHAGKRLIDRAPSAGTAVLLNLGDFFHANDAKARTPRSGHPLDVDGRWSKVFVAGVRICCALTEMALRKHTEVHWRHNPGNHDPEAAVALAVAVQQRYFENPRVHVDIPHRLHWHFRFGEVYIATTHGHTCKKPGDLRDEMTTYRPDEYWGKSTIRHGYVGHRHRWGLYPMPGCTVEEFPTLAAPDAHAASVPSYRSDRDMRCHIWHRTKGLDGQNHINIRTIQRELKEAAA